MAIGNTTKENADHDEKSFTHFLETWAIAYERQHEAQETEGGNKEVKDETNVNNNIEAKIDMDESIVNGGDKTFPTLLLET